MLFYRLCFGWAKEKPRSNPRYSYWVGQQREVCSWIASQYPDLPVWISGVPQKTTPNRYLQLDWPQSPEIGLSSCRYSDELHHAGGCFKLVGLRKSIYFWLPHAVPVLLERCFGQPGLSLPVSVPTERSPEPIEKLSEMEPEQCFGLQRGIQVLPWRRRGSSSVHGSAFISSISNKLTITPAIGIARKL